MNWFRFVWFLLRHAFVCLFILDCCIKCRTHLHHIYIHIVFKKNETDRLGNKIPWGYRPLITLKQTSRRLESTEQYWIKFACIELYNIHMQHMPNHNSSCSAVPSRCDVSRSVLVAGNHLQKHTNTHTKQTTRIKQLFQHYIDPCNWCSLFTSILNPFLFCNFYQIFLLSSILLQLNS